MGRGRQKSAKKCHALFEWPLIMSKTNKGTFVKDVSLEGGEPGIDKVSLKLFCIFKHKKICKISLKKTHFDVTD